MNIKKIPIFFPFDEFQKYDGHELDDDCFCKVKCDNPDSIYMNKKFTITWGKCLKEFVKLQPNKDFEIEEFLKPVPQKTHLKTVLKDLYDNKDLSIDMKKNR